MSNKSSGMNSTLLLTGINTLAILAVLTYVIRNTSDMNAYIDELAQELKSLKASHNDSTKRIHSAISKLNQRVGSRTEPKARVEPKIQEIEDDESINTKVDEVSAAIDELLSN